MNTPHLSEIHIYPVKSARGVSLHSASLGSNGLEFDRHWMVVDEEGHGLTQRKFPRMALIRTELKEDHLSVTGPGMSELCVPLNTVAAKTLHVAVWDDSLEALDAGQDATFWFSEFLGIRCNLVQMPERPSRFIDIRYAPPNSPISFVDAFPLLLISRASLQDLNSRLAEPVPMNRFRPNLVVDGTSAFEEDTWREFQINSVAFLVAKPCARCTIPTVDQESGESGKEPIRTLSAYRMRDSKVYFGQNLIHAGRGILKVGDIVRPIKTQAGHISGLRFS